MNKDRSKTAFTIFSECRMSRVGNKINVQWDDGSFVIDIDSCTVVEVVQALLKRGIKLDFYNETHAMPAIGILMESITVDEQPVDVMIEPPPSKIVRSHVIYDWASDTQIEIAELCQ